MTLCDGTWHDMSGRCMAWQCRCRGTTQHSTRHHSIDTWQKISKHSITLHYMPEHNIHNTTLHGITLHPHIQTELFARLDLSWFLASLVRFSVANWRKASQTPPAKAASLSAAAGHTAATAPCAAGGGSPQWGGGAGVCKWRFTDMLWLKGKVKPSSMSRSIAPE